MLLSLECFIKSLVIAHTGLLRYSKLRAHFYRQTVLQSLWDLSMITVWAGPKFSAKTVPFSTKNYTNVFCHRKRLLPQKVLAILIWEQISENPESLDENWFGSREASLGSSALLSCMVRAPHGTGGLSCRVMASRSPAHCFVSPKSTQELCSLQGDNANMRLLNYV